MAGGTWNPLVGKERPGTYINFETTERSLVGISERGTVIMPLMGHNYGPAGEFITIDNSSPDANYSKLGCSVYEPGLLLVKEALKCAKKVIIYIPTQGSKAKATATFDLDNIEESEIGTEVMATVKAKMGAKSNMTGCNLTYDQRSNTFTVILTGELSGVKNTGIVETLTALVGAGYEVFIDGTKLTDFASVQNAPLYGKVSDMKLGDADVRASIKVSKDDEEQVYTFVVSYPATAPGAQQGLQDITEATGSITGIAMYGGTRGNDLSFDCVANEEEGYDVNVYLENVVVETFESLTTIGDLLDAGSAWIKFSGEREINLTDFSAISLYGGTDAPVDTQSMTKFLDASEGINWNTMAFPVNSKENTSLITALVSKIKYLREDVGKYRKAVVADYVCDYEGIINVANSYMLSDGTVLTHAQATAWVAGADAGADCVTSNTYKVVEDAADIVDLFSHTEAVAAIKAGKFFFSFNEKSEVAVEYDINSLTSFNDGKKAKSWRKNRVLRVLDSFGETCQVNFPPNKYDNDDDGWNVMEGIGKAILKQFGPKSDGGIGAIRNIDFDSDFKVDRTISAGDETYFLVGIQPVDSAEKMFFTITTR